jgi:ankyrin repeat protein/mono/diheme cytochrome c family protein
MTMRIGTIINRILTLFLSWSMLWVGCAPVTSTDLREALDQSKVKAAKKRGDTDLHIAASQGDSTAILALIGKGADINAVNDNDQTPLMMAIRQEQTDTAKLLIAHDAKVDMPDEQGDTALHHAIRAGQLEVVRALLEKGASPNKGNRAKETPLTLATEFDYPDIALSLIAKGAQVAVADGRGLAPLHYAANWRRTAVVQELLARGVEPDVKAPKGQTALMTAAYVGDLPTVTLLLEKGARVEARDEQGQTSLHLAAQKGHRNVVPALLGKGADLNASARNGKTPALFAAQHDHAYLLKDLAEAGARFSPLAETESDMYASALVAQAIAEAALKQKDLPRARDHQKLAGEWFEKAAVAYEDAANSADNKILAKKILVVTGQVLLVVAAGVLGAMAQQQQADFQNKQMAQIAALQDANASGTGTQGYFSRVTQYENAYRNIPPAPSPLENVQPGQIAQVLTGDEKPDLEKLRDLYRKLAEQGRQTAKRNVERLHCLERYSQEAEQSPCLASVPQDLHTVSIPLDSAAAEKGKAIFLGKGTCMNCHGKTGKGDGTAAHILNPRPTNLTSKLALKYQTDGGRFNVMKFGIPGTSMVEMKHLSDEELWVLVAYLKQLAE